MKPEKDMLLKVRVKEAFGINALMHLSQGAKWLTESVQVGTTEMLFGEVKAN